MGFYEKALIIHNTEFKFGYADLNSMLNVRFAKFEKVEIHLNLGISFGLAYTHSTNWINERSFTATDKNVTESVALQEYNKYEVGALTGVSGKFNKSHLELRYQLRSGMSPFLALAARRQIISLLYGYEF